MISFLLAVALVPNTVDLVAVGDIMLGRYVGRRIDGEGIDAAFASVRQEIAGADIAFGNLECPLTRAPFVARKRILLRAKPALASGLGRAGFDVLSVANNHALDAGLPGLRETTDALGAAGIHPIGEKRGAVIFVRNGVRVAFLAYCDFPSSLGIAYLDEKTIATEIARARKGADIVLVSAHWGDEGTSKTSPRVLALSRRMSMAGADVILGHHPHVLQRIEWLPAANGRRCLAAYSLGNFVFDAPNPLESRIALLHVRLSKTGAQAYSLTQGVIERGFPRLNRVDSRYGDEATRQ